MMDTIFLLAKFTGWILLWGWGGWWITRKAFHLQSTEQFLAGMGLGLLLENWLANLLGRWINVPLAFWLAALIVFLAGSLVNLFPVKSQSWRYWLAIPVRPWQIALLLVLTIVFTQVGRGLAIFDDYQNLPVASFLAAGDIPPHFPLDPGIDFSYHYGGLLLTAQIMRVIDLPPWTAIDLSRGFTFALSLLLLALYVRRITHSSLAAFLSGLVTAFAGGTRWLLLLLPASILEKISPAISMIGTSSATASDLVSALTASWAFEGGGSWGLPFAYVNGIANTGVLGYLGGAGRLGSVIAGLLLLTHNRWQGWKGAVVTAIVVAASALSNEVGFLGIGVGLAIVAVIYIIQHHTLRFPKTLWMWIGIYIVACIAAALQGGVLTGVVGNLLAPAAVGARQSYFSFGFKLIWPPAVLSSHLGSLSLVSPSQLLVALAEIGPVILLIPLIVVWGIKAYRFHRWYEAALIFTGLASMLLIFVQYTGNAGPTALIRVQSDILGVCKTFSIPLLWFWVKQRSESMKAFTGGLFFLSLFGGIVLFGFQLLSVPKPVYSTFLTALDDQMYQKNWNKLPEDSLIFDPTASRSPTIFARATNSHITWYSEKEDWQNLVTIPDPYAIRTAGFDYIYLDKNYWDHLDGDYQKMLQDPCVIVVDEVYRTRYPEDFRKLLDISACTP
jgi:hypothetical protein